VREKKRALTNAFRFILARDGQTHRIHYHPCFSAEVGTPIDRDERKRAEDILRGQRGARARQPRRDEANYGLERP